MKIKGFDKNMCCRGMQFEVGKEYKIENNGKPLGLCSDTVFHYCESLQKVHGFYSCNDKANRFCEIEVLGEEITDGEKCGSNHIRIVREIVGDELNQLKGLINGNTGLFNTGNQNTGDWNTGNRNTGKWNTGDWNTGHFNTGKWNTGNWNTGNQNTGDYNTGDRNTGDYNTGDQNTGRFNTGDWNTGYWNACDNSDGVFCTEENKNIRIFNKNSGMSLKEWRDSKYNRALRSAPFRLTEWIPYSEEEMDTLEKKTLGGYLKAYSYQEACRIWWGELTDANKAIIRQIPNFDAKIFKEITGIDVEG